MVSTIAPKTAQGKVNSVLEVTRDVFCLQQPIVNAYFVGAPGGSWVLVDAGLAGFGGRIVRAAAEIYGLNSKPSAIVLTHGHFDHVGALRELAERWDVPVYAHALEMPYLTGKSQYPPPEPAVGGGAMAFLSRVYPRGPLDMRDRVRVLPSDGSVPGMPGWRWLHTPGHAPGHISLFRDQDRTLIAGDAFVTTKQESFIQRSDTTSSGSSAAGVLYSRLGNGSAIRSTARALAPEIAATGHGLPMHGEQLREELEDLVNRWDEIALPVHGRYRDRPAVMDERGVVSLPPAVADPNLLLVAGLGLAGLTLLTLTSRERVDD